MKNIITIILLLFVSVSAFTQNDDKLFSESYSLHLKMQMSFKEIGTNKVKSKYQSVQVYRLQDDGRIDSGKIGLKARGNYRLATCYFPPLWVKISPKDAKGTIAEGHKKLKLVLPCKNNNGANDLILKEYICYRLYQHLTGFSLKAKLVDIDITELRRKKVKHFSVKGILIEDISKVAKRMNAGTIGENAIAASSLEDTSALRFDFFQYMIANTDWSKRAQHNSKLLVSNNRYIPIPYDFDLCGVVDAPYAIVSMVGKEELPIENVTDRFYRGYCASKEITTFIRNEFITKEEELLKVPDELEGQLSQKEIDGIKKYLAEFFDVLKSDKLFAEHILDNCRVKGS